MPGAGSPFGWITDVRVSKEARWLGGFTEVAMPTVNRINDVLQANLPHIVCTFEIHNDTYRFSCTRCGVVITMVRARELNQEVLTHSWPNFASILDRCRDHDQDCEHLPPREVASPELMYGANREEVNVSMGEAPQFRLFGLSVMVMENNFTETREYVCRECNALITAISRDRLETRPPDEIAERVRNLFREHVRNCPRMVAFSTAWHSPSAPENQPKLKKPNSVRLIRFASDCKKETK